MAKGDLEVAVKVLHRVIGDRYNDHVQAMTRQAVLRVVSREFQVPVAALQGGGNAHRPAYVARARQVCAWLLVRRGYTILAVARALGRDQSSVRHAVRQIDHLLESARSEGERDGEAVLARLRSSARRPAVPSHPAQPGAHTL